MKAQTRMAPQQIIRSSSPPHVTYDLGEFGALFVHTFSNGDAFLLTYNGKVYSIAILDEGGLAFCGEYTQFLYPIPGLVEAVQKKITTHMMRRKLS